ncbi:MAG TPA: hypothetical protein VFR02_00680, partial [bacterium]|nr:hypothetical protein [bacterium]
MKKTVLSALILACLASLPVFFGCSPNQSPTGFFTSNTPTPSQGASIVFSRSECGDLLAGNDLSVTVCSVICNQSPSTSRPLTLIENSLGAGFQFQGFGWNGTFPYVDPSVGADPRFTSPNRLSFPNGLAASACVTVLSVFENPDWPANACQTAVADAGVSLSGLPLLSSSVTLQVPCATDTPVFTPTRTPTQTVTITAGPSRTPTPTLTSTFPVTLTGTPTATRTATVSPTASPSTTPSPAFTATASYSPTPTPTGCAKIQLSLSAP